MNENIRPFAFHIAHRMFMATADQNYIAARWAYFRELDIDFYWLSMHAIEKYFKTILLMNGRSAKEGHDLPQLHRKVIAIDSRLSFGPFVKPNIGEPFFRDSSVEDFLERLNSYGSPDNRYMIYGFTVMLDDLLMVDQLIWHVRRHCREFWQRWEDGETSVEIDWVQELSRNRGHWMHTGASLPLENAAKGKLGAEVQEAFSYLNKAFFPELPHSVESWRSGSANPPLADEFMYLESSSAMPETKAEAAERLKWFISNVRLRKSDEDHIKSILDAYSKSLPMSPHGQS